MEQLELKHLSGYLPYGLKGNYEISAVVPSAKYQIRNKELRIDNIDFFLEYAKPILRPLSDLTKEIEHNGEKFVPIEWFEIGDDVNDSEEYDYGNIKLIKTLECISKFNISNDVFHLPHGVVQKLYEWHFAINIPEHLYIDKNTI